MSDFLIFAINLNLVIKYMVNIMLQYQELQSLKGLDMAKIGKSINRGGTEWIVVADGHGEGKVIKFLKQLEWDNIVKQHDPLFYVNELIRTLNCNQGDGTTISLVKINKKGIYCSWIGNSQIRVYCNGVEIWRSRNHDTSNLDETVLSAQRNIEMRKVYRLSVLDYQTITMTNSYFLRHDNSLETTLTRCFGNNNKIYPKHETKFISFDNQPNTWKVVVATDGFWNMTSKSDDNIIISTKTTASQLANIAMLRWGQEWTLQHPNSKFTSKVFISNTRDDISVASWYGKIKV